LAVTALVVPPEVDHVDAVRPRAEHRAANVLREVRAIAQIADILRQIAAHDGHVDARRGHVSVTLAAIVEAVGRAYPDVPPDITRCVIGVVTAVDCATGQPRSP
jgi:hypothetical protein